MFAVVRTGGKQYRVAAGDKIVVEKLAGDAGQTITLGDVLIAGDGSDLKPTDGLTVTAEIIAQAKAEKVIIFKKRRRHNYRRKKGHRQQHTILRIVQVGDSKFVPEAKTAAPADAALETGTAQVEADAPATTEATAPKKRTKKAASGDAVAQAPLKVDGAESEMTDTPVPAKGGSETTDSDQA